MTTPAILSPPAEGVSPDSVRQLAIIEARRSTRRISIWLGFALTILIISGPTTADWPGGSYTEKLPQSFMPIILGTFIAAFRTGRRDAQHNLAQSAPLGADHRALARLASLAVPVVLTMLLAAGLAVVSRIEGGFWLGDYPRRTDTALHPFAELLQMPLVVAFVGVLGIAIGRARPRLSISLVIISGAALFTMFPGYWLWNIPPAHVVTPVQTQPMYIDLDAATNIEQLPTDWFVEIPGTGERESHDDKPTRQLVHQPTIVAHDLYLLGLTAALAGLAVRGIRGRRATWAGAALAVGGVVAQLLVSPL